MKRVEKPTKAAELAKLKREAELLLELQDKHGYMLSTKLPKADRWTTLVSGIKTENLTMTMAVACKLIVPDASALGRRLVASYKEAKPKRKR